MHSIWKLQIFKLLSLFPHKNSKPKHIIILNLIYIFTNSYKETKCLSNERCWGTSQWMSGWWLKEERTKIHEEMPVTIVTKGWMRILFERVSHTASLQWINWLLNPESSGVHFWYSQKSFRQRPVWENLSLSVCVCGHFGWENSISAYYKTEKKQIIAKSIWPLPTPPSLTKTTEDSPGGIGCTPWADN